MESRIESDQKVIKRQSIKLFDKLLINNSMESRRD